MYIFSYSFLKSAAKETILFRLVFILIDNKSKKESYFCQLIISKTKLPTDYY